MKMISVLLIVKCLASVNKHAHTKEVFSSMDKDMLRRACIRCRKAASSPHLGQRINQMYNLHIYATPVLIFKKYLKYMICFVKENPGIMAKT